MGGEPIVVLIFTLIDVFLLSLGHAYTNQVLLWSAIIMFCGVVIFSHKGYFLPLMLFYLPWTPIVRTNPTTNTFVAFIVPVVFLIILMPWLKKGQGYKKEYFALAILITAYTLVVKLLNELPLDFKYLMFILMLFLIPIYLTEYKKDIRFEVCVYFLTAGIISACIASEVLMTNSNMFQYINIYKETAGLTRLSGFYRDANYFSAQILVAIAGLLLVLSKMTRKVLITLQIISIIVLVFYGMQSVSKMFLFCTGFLTVIWIFNLLIEKRRVSYKFGVISVVTIFVAIVISENLFFEQINYYMFRFKLVSDPQSLTTGRSALWSIYLNYLFSNVDKLLFGIGVSQDQIRALYHTNNAHMTIIEITYQLGIIGGLFLVLWWKGVYQDFISRSKMDFVKWIYFLIMAVSVILPWFALDMLYYREFFYFILLLFLSRDYLAENTKINCSRNNIVGREASNGKNQFT